MGLDRRGEDPFSSGHHHAADEVDGEVVAPCQQEGPASLTVVQRAQHHGQDLAGALDRVLHIGLVAVRHELLKDARAHGVRQDQAHHEAEQPLQAQGRFRKLRSQCGGWAAQPFHAPSGSTCEQVCLVLGVVVDRIAGHSGLGGHSGNRHILVAVLKQQLLEGIKQLASQEGAVGLDVMGADLGHCILLT